MSPARRALISVSDKSGIVELARGLSAAGFGILSTGGTASLLAREGIAVTEVSAYTGFPEMLDGRVKTLHPRIHGGLLAPRPREIGEVLIEHLDGLYDLYGDEQGTRVARKHIGWTVRELPGGGGLRAAVNGMTAAHAQRAAVNDYFERLAA